MREKKSKWQKFLTRFDCIEQAMAERMSESENPGEIERNTEPNISFIMCSVQFYYYNACFTILHYVVQVHILHKINDVVPKMVAMRECGVSEKENKE